jgi:hypothetical protein
LYFWGQIIKDLLNFCHIAGVSPGVNSRNDFLKLSDLIIHLAWALTLPWHPGLHWCS